MSAGFKQRSLTYGIPFLILMVAGSFGLQKFSNIRYEYSNKQMVNPEDMKKYGVNMKKREDVTLETEYDKIHSLDIDTWENKRGPRPWEEESIKQ